MKKEGKKYTIIILIVVVIGIVAIVIFNSLDNKDNKPKVVDISHVYVAADFPNSTLDEKNLNVFLEKLNRNYDFLRQDSGFDPYDLWVDIGNTKLGLNDYNGAIEAWEQAISLNELNPLAYANLANLYKDFVKDYAQAEKYYDLAISKDNIGYFPDYQSFAELHIHYLPENSGKVEAIMLSGAEVAQGNNKIPFYYYLYDYFKEKDKSKVDYYRQQILTVDPNFDWSQYE